MPIVKEECLNHVEKCLWRGMKYVVRSFEVQKLLKKKMGENNCVVSLKNSTITKLSKYYKSSSIANKNNVLQIESDVLDPLHHRVSTDTCPRYFKCPKGPESWCFFTVSYVKCKTSGPHERHISKHLSHQKYAFPVYQRLAS